MNNTLMMPHRVVMPEKFKELTEQQLKEKLNPRQFLFACEYINNGHDAVKAWILVYYKINEGEPIPDRVLTKSRTAVHKAFSDSPLIAYLYLIIKRTANQAAIKQQYTFETWFNDLVRLREGAAAAEQYGPAIQAHKMLGAANALLTPTERQQVANKSSQSLIERLERLNPAAAKALAPHLGIESDTQIIEAEIISENPGCEIDDLL